MGNFASKFSFKSFLNMFRLTNYFTGAQIRNYFIIVPSIALLFILIYAPIKIFKTQKIEKSLRSKRVFTAEEVTNLLTKPGIEDLMFPDNLFEFAPTFVASPGKDSKWSQQAVEKYWADPSVVGISKLPERNQKLLEDYLEKASTKDKNF